MAETEEAIKKLIKTAGRPTTVFQGAREKIEAASRALLDQQLTSGAHFPAITKWAF